MDSIYILLILTSLYTTATTIFTSPHSSIHTHIHKVMTANPHQDGNRTHM